MISSNIGGELDVVIEDEVLISKDEEIKDNNNTKDNNGTKDNNNDKDDRRVSTTGVDVITSELETPRTDNVNSSSKSSDTTPRCPEIKVIESTLPRKEDEIIRNDMTWKDFIDLQFIGAGQFANVFCGIYNQKSVAIKLLKQNRKATPRANADARNQLKNELKMLCKLNHPNIVKLYGSGIKEDEDLPFIVMEYLQMGTLNDQINKAPLVGGFFSKKKQLPQLQVVKWSIQLGKALNYLQNYATQVDIGVNIIHRDLKPDNIGFNAKGDLKLMDFGLCRAIKKKQRIEEKFELTGETGSLRYMAPEVNINAPYNEKVDTYSYGLIVWQMFTCRKPFQDLSSDMFTEWIVMKNLRPQLKPKEIPPQIADLLTFCWDANADSRPGMGYIITELSSYKVFLEGKVQKKLERKNSLNGITSIFGGKH